MEYFLAIDKGKFYDKKDRFKKLSLLTIDQKRNKNTLTKDNNLEALATFTMTFNNPYELKAFLLNKGILLDSLKNYDIVIIYEEYYGKSSFTRVLTVPYKSYEAYLKIDSLAKIIYRKVKKSKSFLERYLNFFAREYQRREFYELKKTALNSPDLLEKIRNFLKSISTDYGNYDYQGLFEAGMLMASFDRVRDKMPKPQTIEPTKKETEEVLSNDYPDEDQFRLF